MAARALIIMASSVSPNSAPTEQQPWFSSSAGSSRMPRQPRPQMQVQFDRRKSRSTRQTVSPSSIRSTASSDSSGGVGIGRRLRPCRGEQLSAGAAATGRGGGRALRDRRRNRRGRRPWRRRRLRTRNDCRAAGRTSGTGRTSSGRPGRRTSAKPVTDELGVLFRSTTGSSGLTAHEPITVGRSGSTPGSAAIQSPRSSSGRTSTRR